MSEKLYALLLRLYPARFRAAYADEALQLFRDRLRDETGFFARFRLALDLLLDLGLSLPREHRAHGPALAPSRSEAGLFRVLDTEPPRPGAFLFGSALALTGVLAFFFLLEYAGVRHPAHPQDNQSASAAPVSTPSAAAGGPATAAGDTAILRPSAAPAPAASAARQDAATPLHISVLPAALDPAERHRVILAVADDVLHHYYDRSLAQTAAAALLTAEKNGRDDKIATGNELAAALTRQLTDATRDLHTVVIYSARPIPAVRPQPTPRSEAALRQSLLDRHCLIERTRILPGDLGYLKFNGFPDPSICGAQFRSALLSLRRSRALILDLTGNFGGQPAMVALLAGDLFNRPEPWYNPKQPGTSSLAPAPGPFAHTPVYILTSRLTLSAAEQFSYNLQALHRATIVGEVTAGRSDTGVFHRIDDHFGVAIPEFRMDNPYPGRDWAVVGVQPDIPVPASQALAAAEHLAAHRLTQEKR